MTALLTGLSALLLLLVLLLAVPIEVHFDLALPDAPGARDLSLRWGPWRVRRGPLPAPSVTRGAAEQPAGEGGSRHRKPRRRRRRGPAASAWLATLRDTRLRRRLLRYLAALWRALHARQVRGRLRIGLHDPADTGRLWGLLGPLDGWLASQRHLDVRLQPAFPDAALEGEASGVLCVVPLQVLALSAGLLLSPAVWRGVHRLAGAGA